ncbi:Fur family transcriptional regulator [Pseudomonas sp. RIT-PI-AD]|uniref:Fur family transcriptional regulator n=1 Tax=Pseudomonas sp. RIT-PI-AD TaxID=3035294 RepID=UPI0021D9CC56|nr:Fur family transcriptional regulator [Pseudomonas sp. RIT-PI-AD]
MENECKRQLKERLREAGLKTSLPRLKILEALHRATLENGGASARALHDDLVEAGVPLSLGGVRQVICRLSSHGLILHEANHRYSFSLEGKALARVEA